MIGQGHVIGCAAALTVLVSTAVVRGSATPGDILAAEPETVMVTFHAKTGSETELAGVIARHWETARRLNLVLDAPHLTVRGTENGRQTYFIDVFTWRDAGIPDQAPAAIRSIWADMNRLVESRGARPGLDFAEVTVVDK